MTPRRYDLAVKYRLFRHLLDGNDPDAVRVYEWHIAKRRASGFYDGHKPSLDVFLPQAEELLNSMQVYGFGPAFPIPVDPEGELLGGAHRTACALALGLDEVWVERRETRVWAPPWGLGWFVEQGMTYADLSRVQQDFKVLMEMRASSSA